VRPSAGDPLIRVAGPGVQAAAAAGRAGLAAMPAKAILGGLGALFLLLGLFPIVRGHGQIGPASRTWITIGIIFALVSAYLWITQ
jgi:hypothetical protein